MNKQHVQSYVKKYGFDTIDELAFQKIKISSDTIMTNILNNIAMVIQTYPAKRITKKQFAIILHILNSRRTCEQKTQTGGGTILPMEYFDPNHATQYGAEFSQQVVPQGIARAELIPYTQSLETVCNSLSGGGTSDSLHLIDENYVKEFFKNYITENKLSISLSKEGVTLMISSVEDNLDILLKECKQPKTKKLTGNKIYSVLKSKPAKYMHLSCIVSF